MRHLAVLTAIAVLAAFDAGSASAQTIRDRMGNAQPETVSSAFDFTLPFDGKDDVAKQQEEALKLIYSMAGKSCTLMLGTIASECKISAISTTVRITMVDRVPGALPSRSITASGQVTMAVKFIDQGSAAKP